jgi:hypothetical protein
MKKTKFLKPKNWIDDTPFLEGMESDEDLDLTIPELPSLKVKNKSKNKVKKFKLKENGNSARNNLQHKKHS